MSTKIQFEEILKINKGEPMPSEVNAFIRDSMPKEMYENGIEKLLERIEARKWFGKLVYPKDAPRYEFSFRYGVCQFFTTVFTEGNASFYMNTKNPNIDFRRNRNEGNQNSPE